MSDHFVVHYVAENWVATSLSNISTDGYMMIFYDSKLLWVYSDLKADVFDEKIQNSI